MYNAKRNRTNNCGSDCRAHQQIPHQQQLNRLLCGDPKHDDTRDDSTSSTTSVNDVATHHGHMFFYPHVMSKTPKVEPTHVQEYTVKQSKYDVVGKLPIRSVILGPSGSGKTVLLQNMIWDIYKDCFSRIFIFSPSIEVDHTWKPVKNYNEKHVKVNHTAEEPIYFDHYDPEALANILETQHKITNFLKKRGDKKLFQILIIVDDFADDPSLPASRNCFTLSILEAVIT
jgi:hypothetical protein